MAAGAVAPLVDPGDDGGGGSGGSGSGSGDGDTDCNGLKKMGPCGDDDDEVITGPVLDPWTEAEKTAYFDDTVFTTYEFRQNECLKSVYDAMGKASTFAGYLKNFDGDMSVADLRFGYDVNFSSNQVPEVWDAMAITNPPDNNIIKIDFNGDSSLSASIHDKPKLLIAVGFIHEILHAEIYRKMMDAVLRAEREGTTETTLTWLEYDNPNQVHHEFLASLINNYEGIHDYYTRFYYFLLTDNDPSNDPSTMDAGWQHQQISQHYRNTIISAISEYDNYQHSSGFYEALSWLGLMGTGNYNSATGLYENSTEAWKSIDSDPTVAAQKRKMIHNTILNFQNNATDICN